MSFFSTSQMDNFYEAFASGAVKPSSVMNFIQHLYIAERCPKGASVLDVCCGRALMVPLLKRHAPDIALYVGLDISFTNLGEAQGMIKQKDMALPFPCYFIQGDVTQVSSLLTKQFDLIIYTSSLEHLDRQSGILSLHQVSKALSEDGVLYLSTPRTVRDPSYKLQYKVHVYEWDREELEEVLNEVGLTIVECIGLLPPPNAILSQLIEARFGMSARTWFREMRRLIPSAFLDPVMAACFPEVAKELLYICKRRDSYEEPWRNSG